MKRLLRTVSFALILVPGTLILGGGWRVMQQDHALASAKPTDARILAVDVGTHRDVHSISQVSERFWPVVRYSFEHAGSGHQSDNVLPLSASGTREWAQRLAARFRVGTTATAWVTPSNPQRAFLVRDVDPSPFVLMLLGIPLVWLWLFVRTRLAQQWAPPTIIDFSAPSTSTTWTVCAEHDGPSRRLRRAIAGCAVWLFVVGFCVLICPNA